MVPTSHQDSLKLNKPDTGINDIDIRVGPGWVICFLQWLLVCVQSQSDISFSIKYSHKMRTNAHSSTVQVFVFIIIVKKCPVCMFLHIFSTISNGTIYQYVI